MILDFEFEEEENFGYEFEQGEEFNMEPLDERTDLFPVRSVDGVKADPDGNIDLTETRDTEIARQLKAMQESGAFDGEDGYTPIKGVDYFDGEDGYTPVKGVDYFDGKDGRAPIKGVDYFDGKDGYTPIKGKDYFDGKDGISPTVGVSPIDGGYKITVTDKDGSRTIDLMNGRKGDDGFSPDVNVTDIANGKKITITDARGATTFYLYDGEDGYTPEKGKDYTDGKDGVSPTVDITDIAGGHRIAITDKDGTNSFDVMNGEGAGDVTSAMLAAAVANHNTAGDSHNDLRLLIDAIAVPTKPSDIGAQPAGDYLTSFTESDPTVPSWAKQANKPSYTAAEVGADPSGTASGAVSTHNGASNAHSALFNKKANDYSLEIYNDTGGNPKPVRFLTVGYDTCDSENGVAIKIGMVSGHGNGSSYAFLEDVIVKVNYQGGVSVDNFKYYGADAGTYDGAARQYGDIFWVNDTANKLVTFYVLMGQYARVNSIPYKRLTYSTGGTITQPTSNAVYSSGEKVWANNSEIATKSDIPAVPTKTEQWTFTYEDGTTATREVYVK